MRAAAPHQARMEDGMKSAGGEGAAMGDDDVKGRKKVGVGRPKAGSMPALWKKM